MESVRCLSCAQNVRFCMLEDGVLMLHVLFADPANDRPGPLFSNNMHLDRNADTVLNVLCKVAHQDANCFNKVSERDALRWPWHQSDRHR